MESIIRKRHPNSLPVLMWAANAAVENHPTEGEGSKPLSVRYLEDRCKKLEAEVDSKDEEAKKSLRVMEQKYTSMKVSGRSTLLIVCFTSILQEEVSQYRLMRSYFFFCLWRKNDTFSVCHLTHHVVLFSCCMYA